jgi:hypothetical protein
MPACFTPADQVARGRVYFQAEGEPAWYFVEMKPRPPCWAGVLPKPSRSLINRHVRYYVETIGRSLGSARTSEYTPLVVGKGLAAFLARHRHPAPALEQWIARVEAQRVEVDKALGTPLPARPKRIRCSWRADCSMSPWRVAPACSTARPRHSILPAARSASPWPTRVK